MKKNNIFMLLAVLLLIALASEASAAPAWYLLETLTVNSNGLPVVTSANTLDNGWLYRLEVSGTYDAGASITADAEYSSGPPSYVWQDLVEGYEGYGEGLLELKVNGSFVEWGPYNVSHVYTMDYVGEGSTVNFQIYDLGGGSNNSGSLTVKIYATPVMVSTSLSGPTEVEVGEEASWDITITVEAKYADVTDVVVQDGMGADLDEIVLGTPTQGGASTETRGQGKKGATMVIWNVGALTDGDSETLVVTVTTGSNASVKNPKHEFTSVEDDHPLDGGASAIYMYDGTEYKTPETDPLTVDVVAAP